jgi:hypothetical protein
MIEEVGELELRDELPEGKLQEPSGVKNEWEDVRCQEGCPGSPYIEFEARACTKEEGSPERRIVSLREEPS